MLVALRPTRAPVLFLGAVLALGATACDDDDDNVAPPTADQAQVKVVHAIANAGTVSVLVDDTPVKTGFAFPEVFPSGSSTDPLYAGVDPGARRLRVNLANGTTAIDQTVNLSAATNYTVIAAGTAGGTGALAPAYILLTDDVSAPPSGAVRLRAVHAASSVPAVDVHVAPGAAAPFTWTRAFQNVQFRQSATATPPAGSYTVCVTLAGTAPTSAGGNCAILFPSGALTAGAAITAIARDPVPGQTAPSLIVTLDRRP